MKTERIEFVAPSGLKTKLQKEAAKAKISVGELIRQRFEPSEEERELVKLTMELKKATVEASSELAQAVGTVDALVSELRSRRKKAELQAALLGPRRRSLSEVLAAMLNVGEDGDFVREQEDMREV